MKFILGALLIALSIFGFVTSVLTLNYFSKCRVPLGDWSIFFSCVVLNIGIFYIARDSMIFSDSKLKYLLTATVLLMIIVFIWGDLLVGLTLFSTPHCVSAFILACYGLINIAGTALSAIEGFFILQRVVE